MTRQRVCILGSTGSVGTSTLEVFPGRGFGDMRSATIQTLRIGDAEAIARLDYVHSVTPSLSTSATLPRSAMRAR